MLSSNERQELARLERILREDLHLVAVADEFARRALGGRLSRLARFPQLVVFAVVCVPAILIAASGAVVTPVAAVAAVMLLVAAPLMVGMMSGEAGFRPT